MYKLYTYKVYFKTYIICQKPLITDKVAYCLSQIICVVFEHARKYISLHKYIGFMLISQIRDGIFSTYKIPIKYFNLLIKYVYYLNNNKIYLYNIKWKIYYLYNIFKYLININLYLNNLDLYLQFSNKRV